MKKIKPLLLLFVMAVTLLACSDDYVDVESPDEVAEQFFNTPQDYEDALIAAYDLLAMTHLSVMLGDIASDNTLAGGENANDVIGIQQIDDMIQNPVNQQLQDHWNWMYAGVYRTSYIMEFQNNLDFPNKARVLGETRFLRAYYNFELVKFFGDIPFKVDERIFPGEEKTLPRSPASEVYALMEQDLQFAIDNLEYSTPDVGRATRGSAQAMLGKVLLYQGKFSEAAAVLDDIINSGQYSLVTDYSTIWENDNENNEESVFEVQYSDIQGAGFDCFACSEGNIAVGFNGIRNYNGPDFDSGFSFNVPTQETYDAFESGDIRRDVAILDINAFAAATGATFATGNEHTGYYNRKYIARDGDRNTGDANLTNPNNYRAIRLADVYLMAAEAYNSGGLGDTQARTYLNIVRNRAGLSDVTSTGGALGDAIFQERRVELVGEGHRYFDLVRTNRAEAIIDGYRTATRGLFPIPFQEIRLSGGLWEQNEGY